MTNIVLIIVSIFLSGFFSGAEIAFFSLSNAKVESAFRKGKTGLGLVRTLKNKPEKLLITILIGNNIVNIGASSLMAVAVTEAVGESGVGIATAVMTLLILTFGEIIPKTVATKYNLDIAIAFSPLLYGISMVLSPIIAIFELISTFINSILPDSKDSENNPEEELSAIAHMGEETGHLEDYENQFIQKVFTLNDTLVKTAMVPIEDVFMVSIDNSVSEVVAKVREMHHSRVPVYSYESGEIQIKGFLFVRDVIKTPKHKWSSTKLGDIIREPIYVSTDDKLSDVMEEFFDENIHIAIVEEPNLKSNRVMTHNIAGIITLEDIVEEVLGEIEDETDVEAKR